MLVQTLTGAYGLIIKLLISEVGVPLQSIGWYSPSCAVSYADVYQM